LSDINSFVRAATGELVEPPLIIEATFVNQLCVSDLVAKELEANAIAANATSAVIAPNRALDFFSIERLELGDEVFGVVEKNILIEAPNRVGGTGVTQLIRLHLRGV